MPKHAILKDKLQQANKAPAKATLSSAIEKQAERNGGRGRLIGVHVSDAAYKEFRLLAAEKDLKHNELLRQALNAYLKANGRDPIA
jgi:hypothetical protein